MKTLIKKVGEELYAKKNLVSAAESKSLLEANVTDHQSLLVYRLQQSISVRMRDKSSLPQPHRPAEKTRRAGKRRG